MELSDLIGNLSLKLIYVIKITGFCEMKIKLGTFFSRGINTTLYPDRVNLKTTSYAIKLHVFRLEDYTAM